jgi:hypothetical protein
MPLKESLASLPFFVQLPSCCLVTHIFSPHLMNVIHQHPYHPTTNVQSWITPLRYDTRPAIHDQQNSLPQTNVRRLQPTKTTRTLKKKPNFNNLDQYIMPITCGIGDKRCVNTRRLGLVRRVRHASKPQNGTASGTSPFTWLLRLFLWSYVVFLVDSWRIILRPFFLSPLDSHARRLSSHYLSLFLISSRHSQMTILRLSS